MSGELRMRREELERLRRLCLDEADALTAAARLARRLREDGALRAAEGFGGAAGAGRVRELVHRALDSDAGLVACAERVRQSAEGLRAAAGNYAEAEAGSSRAMHRAGAGDGSSGGSAGGFRGGGFVTSGGPRRPAGWGPDPGTPPLAPAASVAAAGGAEAAGARPAVSVRRAEILERAARWADHPVPYTMSGYHGGWRADCSGFVSMAWRLDASLTTVSLPEVSHLISKEALLPGDILLNTRPGRYGHVVIFDRWADSSHSSYLAYEQSPGGTKHRVIPYPYFVGHGSFEPYRLDGLSG